MKHVILAAAILACIGSIAARADESAIDEMFAVAERATKSIVTVELDLQIDRGEEPPGRWPQIREERPFATIGLLMSSTECIIDDPELQRRFIRDMRVTRNGKTVSARPKSYLIRQSGIIIEFDEPFDDAIPFEFNDKADEKYTLSFVPDVDGWVTLVTPFSSAIAINDRGRRFQTFQWRSGAELTADADGVIAGFMTMRSWSLSMPRLGNPNDSERVDADRLDELKEEIRLLADAVVPRVRLNFRSPQTTSADRWSRQDDESATERHVAGLIISPERVLVMANLQPKTTGMLERITVFLADGTPINARFEHTLKDDGAFTALLDKKVDRFAEFSSEDPRDMSRNMLLNAEVRIHGEDRLVEISRTRVNGMSTGWQNRKNLSYKYRSQDGLVFDMSGRLVAMSLARRERVTSQRWGARQDTDSWPVGYLREILDDLPANADPGNVPLSEEQERMVAWMGVELQALNRELARMNNVAHLTNDGQMGAIVSHIYAGSPAEAAGIQLGDVLLRLHVQGQHRPLEVRLEDRFVWSHQPFPWDRLDEVTEQYYDQIPAPWPSVENTFVRALTDTGLGRPYVAEFFRDGEVVRKEFETVLGPPHYEAAPRYKSETIGLTVRDLSYEVRRYYQRTPEDPGLIISAIEMGSRASVAGLKPYEIITHINEAPVHNVKQFEEMIAGDTELRFSVNRMHTGRIVKIRLPEKRAE